MDFTPKTEQQIDEERLAPTGEYTFEVVKAIDTTSAKGNPMITVTLGIYEPAGDRVKWYVTDYLLTAMLYKLRHFCATTGKIDLYNTGKLTAQDCTGLMGVVKIDVEDANGTYRAKNVVVDYVKPGEAQNKPTADLPSF